MTPDELRALADALDRLKFRCDGIDDACLVEDAADYLRACADVQPVAWLYRDWANVLKVSQLDPHEDGAFAVFAEPQPQAEPKREPLTYEQLVSACYTYRHDFGLLDPDEQELVIEEAGRWAKAFGIGDSDEY